MEVCNEKTDEELMGNVLVHREYFACLVSRYEKKLLRYVLRFMPGLQEEAIDLLQEVFIKVYVNANDFDPSLKFSSWIYRIAHNEAVSWLRKKKARPDTVVVDDEDIALLSVSEEMSSSLHETHLSRDTVERVLERMKEKHRTILILRFMEGKQYDEIADILKIPEGTVATNIHRAKKEFISLYTQHHAQ